MAGNTKNLGQAAGIHVGTTPPTNVKIIWWDSTPSQQVHKVYDYNLKDWVIINQNILSTITYTELRNLATNVGLSLGKFYVITDRGNVLAISITKTKIQYVDISGNLLVDDLGSNITYFVSSNNLTIDGETGAFNEETTKLNFEFFEVSQLNFETAYIFGRDVENSSNIARLIKFRLKSLISAATGNSLSWNNGLYFNFSESISNLGDKSGGVVSYDTYEKEQDIQDQSIENIANNYSALLLQMTTLINSSTSSEEIMDKKVPALSTTGAAIDPAAGDTLYTVLSKIQRYINKFKYATGIYLSKNFSEITSSGKVNNNDSVETAVAKLQNQQSNIVLSLPEDWTPFDKTNQNLTVGENYNSAFSKIEADRRVVNDLDMPITDVELADLGYDSYESLTVKFRINNGMLEIFLDNPTIFQWFYTRVVVDDYMHVFPLKFTDEVFKKISPFFYGLEEYIDSGNFDGKIINPLITVPVSKVQVNQSSEWLWVDPNFDYKVLVSFGYFYDWETSQANPVRVKRIGLILSPVSCLTVKDNALQLESLIVNRAFQGSLPGSPIRITLPPITIRYKLW